MRKAVITGLGVVSPVGSNLRTFWQNISGGVSGIRRLQAFDTTNFAVQIAGEVTDLNIDEYIAPKEQRRMDRYCHFAISAAKMAMTDAGLAAGQFVPERSGCLLGTGVGGIRTVEVQHEILVSKGPGRCSPFTIPQMIPNMAAGLIGIEMGLKGPNFAPTSACAASAHSIGEALRIIQRGEADMMLAGGSEAPICALAIAGFASMKALCSTHNDNPTKGSRPFDLNRSGFVMGEGAVVVVMEEMEAARKRGAQIYAEVAGFGMTCDAFHMTAPDEDGTGAARAIQLALADAKLPAESVEYISAHGTSTPLNDKIETKAVKLALGLENARKVMMSSTKSMTGHLLGAAAGVETAATLLGMKYGVVPPTINHETPDPECDLDCVPNAARERPFKVALKNSMGFGGHNASLVFAKV